MTDTNTTPRTWPDGSLDDSVLKPLWLDSPDRPAPRDSLTENTAVDLLVVGAGFTGLWTALRAVERNPAARVLVVEADRIAEHATGRNGGFCEASLTHGEANGLARWPAGVRRAARAGAAQPRRHRGDHRPLRLRLRLHPRRGAGSGHPPARGGRPRARPARLPRRRRRAEAGRLADLPRGPARARRLRPG